MLLGILSLLASIGIAFAQYYPTNGGLGYGQLSPGPRYQGPMYSGVPPNVMQSPNYYPGYSPAAMPNLPVPAGINPALSMPMPMSMPVAMGSNENSNEMQTPMLMLMQGHSEEVCTAQAKRVPETVTPTPIPILMLKN